MPANDFKITDIVDQSAFEQLSRLSTQFDQLKQKYTDIATAIGKGIGMPAGTLDELATKMQQFNTNGQEMAKVQAQLMELQQKYEQLLAEVNRKVAEATRASAEYAKTSVTLERAYKTLGQARSDESLELAVVREKTRQANQEIKNQAKLLVANEKVVNDNTKSYNQLSAEYSLLKQRINDMSMAERQTAAGRELEQHLRDIREQMNEMQKSTGNFSLNVGNYSNSIREALGLSGPMGAMLDKIITAGPKASDTFKAMGAAVKGVHAQTIALVSNPIVATIAAIAGVVMLVSKGISSSEENMQKWRKITAPMNALLDTLLNILQKAVGWLLDMAIAVGKVVRSVLKLMENLPFVGKYIKDFNDISEKSVGIAERQNKLDTRKREVTLQNAKDQKEIARLEHEAAAVRYKDTKKYQQLLNQSMKLQKDISTRNKEIAQEEAEVLDLRNSFAQNTKETNDEIANAYAKAEDAEAQYYQRTRRDVSKLASAEKKDAADAAKIQKERMELALKQLDESSARRVLLLNEQHNKELEGEAELYRLGFQNYEEYQKNVESANREYAKKALDIALDVMTQQLEVEGLTAEKRTEIEKKIYEKKIELATKVRDWMVSDKKKEEDENQKKLDKMIKQQEDFGKRIDEYTKQYMQEQQQFIEESVRTIEQLTTAIADIISNHYDQQLKELEKSTEAQQARIERLAELGAITTEEAEARKRAAEEATEAKREEIMKKQADAQKAANIANTIMNTAVAIMKAWSQGGIFAAPMAALIAAQGAIQLATIMSTKAYAEGTNNAAGGWSIVGDGGRPEIVLSRGKAWLTPDTPTLVNLNRGDKVLPDAQAVLTAKMMSDYAMLSEQLKDKRDEGVTVNVTNDHNDLRKEMELSNEQLDDIKRILRKQAHNADYMRIYARV